MLDIPVCFSGSASSFTFITVSVLGCVYIIYSSLLFWVCFKFQLWLPISVRLYKFQFADLGLIFKFHYCDHFCAYCLMCDFIRRGF